MVAQDFTGKVVIVTGSGSGIGRSCALKFAALGASVVVADVNKERAEAVTKEIRQAGHSAVAVVGDLADQAVVDSCVRTAIDEFGQIDVLVNNAGIMDAMSAPDEVTDSEWDRVLRTNLTAPFLLMRAVAPVMLEKGRGAIVNTTSEAALRGGSAGTPYTVSKHGLVGLTRSAATMYRGRGIRVNAVAPGATATNIEVPAVEGLRGPSILGTYLGALGRIADPDEVADVIVFLASESASNVSGTVVPVDNGWAAA